VFVVDCSFTGHFGGMMIKEISYLMLDQGCTKALNLDGGGSSTMLIEGSVVNQPHGKILEDGKYVEAVSDAILIF
jgi:exopolysaccharide biosynthesis protein